MKRVLSLFAVFTWATALLAGPPSVKPSPSAVPKASPVASASSASIAPASPVAVASASPVPSAPPEPEPAIFPANAPAGDVRVMKVTGVINLITEEYFNRVIKLATEEKASLILVEIDTPGGLMSSMWDIIKDMYNSKVPVVVYVTPSGAHAASAGTFILMASHVAAMAPSTTIGAAHPVRVTPGDDDKDVMMKKVVNDAVTRMQQNARHYGRNAQWAEKAIRDCVTTGTEDAVKQKVVELAASSRSELLEKLENRIVKMGDGSHKRIHVKGARVVETPMTTREEILHTVSDPEIGFALVALGAMAFWVEISNPGVILPGIVGVFSMALGAMGLQFLPINYVGVILIVFAFVMFVLELKIPSHGLLSLTAIISLAMGSVMLIDSPLPALQIPKTMITAVVGTISFTFIFILGKVAHDLRQPYSHGLDAMVGLAGVSMEDFSTTGMVKVRGEIWKALSEGTAPIREGEPVKVVGVKDDLLQITPADKGKA
jgi:membrane-bound serine protease (ClpP class)